MDFRIKENGYHPEKITDNGNRFLIGNGYMGIRGTLDEYEKDRLPAVNLAGIYDKAGDGWREPLNAPNICFAYLRVDGEMYRLPEKEAAVVSHNVELDYRHGLLVRQTIFKTPRGNVTYKAERFVDQNKIHLVGMRYRITADFHADVELVTGIDADVWEINGPHFDSLSMSDENGLVFVGGITHEKKAEVWTAENVRASFPLEQKIIERDKKILRRIFFVTEIGKEYTIERCAGVYTSVDCDNPKESLISDMETAIAEGYDVRFAANVLTWENLWENSEVLIEGDDVAYEALNYSLYHLHCIAPRHSESMSIPARGLSGQTYKGAIFWDTEMFMLDFFLLTEPKTAKTFLKYRIDTLPGAKKKAKEYGFDGAFYAWESQEGGFDACSDYNVTDVFTGRPMRTFFRDKQIHISAAVAYGIKHYMDVTGDESLLSEGGAETVLECAAFYRDCMIKRANRDYYEIWDVIGPDEYHERVNNNAYTNRMAKVTFNLASDILKEMLDDPEKLSWVNGMDEEKAKRLLALYEDSAANLYQPSPNKDGVIEQFDGYLQLEDATLSEVRSRILHEKEYWGGAYGVAAHTQIIKQADVVTMLNLFANEYTEDVLKANLDYYEPRTEHGSSLSACMYGMLMCKMNQPNRAYPFFLKSASADLQGGGKEWAGLIYIGGTHPAAAGGAYKVAIEGFAGVSFENGEIKIRPSLPDSISRMKFRVCVQSKRYEIDITRGGVRCDALPDA